MSETAKSTRGRISGAWKKTGSYGTFFTGNFTRSGLQAELDKYPGVENFQLFVSPVENSENENAPDLNISFDEKKPFVK